jgi:hypothetical protein
VRVFDANILNPLGLLAFYVVKFQNFQLTSPLNILVTTTDYLLNNGVFLSQNNAEKQFKIPQTHGEDMKFF